MSTVNRHTSRRSLLNSFGKTTLACLAAAAIASTGTLASNQAHAGGEEVLVDGLFDAMEAGAVEAKFIPQSSAKANLLVKNLTDKPLHIRVPAAFAGVPVLAQGMMGGMGGMGGGMGGMGGGMGGMGGGMGGGGQAMGGGGGMGGGMGGMGGMGGGMGGMGGGMGGFMRVAPGRTSKMALNTVCLEHGKPEPNAKMQYAIVPLEKVSKDPAVAALCEALGNGAVAQNTAQAATWHLTDDMSWEELAAKNRKESKYTGNIPYFTAFEIRAAANVVGEVKRVAAAYQDQLETNEKTKGGLTLDNSYGS
ncbi:hypothetical protein [Rhodopirellula halodulae]|uniref:hypothetical protein n=1 Tax=Rhodopirellula halodulae TaxID=2894198 RepID=UPI001E5AB28A|nr:hypothetical protein [Rhodopirellula sp. JC737]MCC9657807.1 hypothetical protein [Rhodopirellula sp. JC737]